MITMFKIYEKIKTNIKDIKVGDYIIIRDMVELKNVSDFEFLDIVKNKIGKVIKDSETNSVSWANLSIEYPEELPKTNRTILKVGAIGPQGMPSAGTVIFIGKYSITKAFISPNENELKVILKSEQFDL